MVAKGVPNGFPYAVSVYFSVNIAEKYSEHLSRNGQSPH
jgi:hypothetical protein